MGVHCTVYILNIIIMKNQEKGKREVREYKEKGVLEQRLTYVFKINIYELQGEEDNKD